MKAFAESPQVRADLPRRRLCGSLPVLGLGPIGDMACRIAQQKWIDKIVAVDLVDERLERALAHGVQVIAPREHEDDLPEVVRELTDGRGLDSVIDAVGMEAHDSPGAAFARRVTAHLPDAVTEPLMKKAGLDRLAALYTAIETVRRGGTISLSGCLRRHGRSDADDVVVRQAGSAPDGPGQ